MNACNYNDDNAISSYRWCWRRTMFEGGNSGFGLEQLGLEFYLTYSNYVKQLIGYIGVKGEIWAEDQKWWCGVSIFIKSVSIYEIS